MAFLKQRAPNVAFSRSAFRTHPLQFYCSSVPFPASRSPDAHVPPRSEQEAEPRRRGGGGGGHGVHPVHLPAQHGGFEEGVAAGGGAGERPRSRGAEDAAGGRGAAGPGVAPAVAAEPRGAGERERAGGSHVLVQVREQGRRGRRHLRQPGQGRLRPRRRRAVLQLHGDAGGGGHLRQDGGAAEPENPPRGHPPHAGGLRGRPPQDRGAAPRRRQVRRQGRRRPDGARPGHRRDQRVHPRLRRQEGLNDHVQVVDRAQFFWTFGWM